MKELKKAFEEYKEDTLKLISAVEKEDYDLLEELLDKRQKTIESINKLTYTAEELSEIVEELQILVYQEKLAELMVKKRDSIKEELSKISQAKNANSMYNNKIYNTVRVFNKTI